MNFIRITNREEYKRAMKLYNSIKEDLTPEGLHIPDSPNNIRRSKIADALMEYNYNEGSRKRKEEGY